MGTLSRRSFVTALTTGMAAAALGACSGAPVTLSSEGSSTAGPRAARGRALPIPPLATERAAEAGSRRPSVDCFVGRLVGVDADFGVLRFRGRC